MMEIFEMYLNRVSDSAQIQTALMTIVGGGAVGALSWLLLKLPTNVLVWLKRQSFTTLEFNTAGTSWSYYNQMQYAAFISWFSKNPWFRLSRRLTLEGDSDGRKQTKNVGPGAGRHILFRYGRFFIIHITEKESSGVSVSKFSLSISVLGRSKKPLYRLMNEFMIKHDAEDRISVYQSGSDDHWTWLTYTRKRPLDTVFLDKAKKAELINSIQWFIDNPEWYHQRGLSYKRTFLLYGPHGTGKSSIIRAIASHFNRDLYIVNLAKLGSNVLALLQKARGGVVLFEDIDGLSIACSKTARLGKKVKRSKVNDATDKEDESPKLEKNSEDDLLDLLEMYGGGVSGLLNALDGVVGLEDTLVFLTTNHPEKLNETLIRDSRVDVRMELGLLTDDVIREYLVNFFPGIRLPAEVFPDVAGGTLQKLTIENRDNPIPLITKLLNSDYKSNEF